MPDARGSSRIKPVHMRGATMGFPFCQALPFPSKMPQKGEK